MPKPPPSPDSRLALPRPLLEALCLGVLAGAAAGVVVGAVGARDYLAAGFLLPFLELVRQGLYRGLAGGIVLALAWLGLRQLLVRRRVARIPAGALAAALVAAPAGLLLAYHFNRSRGLHPRDLLEPFGLLPNLQLLAFFLLVAAVATGGLEVWARRRLARPGRPPWRSTVTVLVLALALSLGLGALARPAAGHQGGHHVLVLLVDALRADHLGVAGYERPTTPNIDALAADGVLFTQAVAPSTFTKSTIASLFTGRNVHQHGVYWGNLTDSEGRVTSDRLEEEEETLAELFRDNGFLTAAFVQNSHLRSWMGFAQGFLDYRDQQGDIERIHRAFLRWLQAARHARFFAYLHYIDLHDPYRPPPPWSTMFGTYSDVYRGVDFREWGAYLEAVRQGEITLSPEDVEQLRAYYDGELRRIDEEIGEMLRALQRRGLYDRTLIVLTSDHGDGFMEHGFISHSTTPYEELVRVPLILKMPESRWAGTVVDRQVRLVDLYPTLRDLLGLSGGNDEIAGCSLLPVLRGADTPRGEACDIAIIEIAEEGWEPTVAVRTERYKYILGRGLEELYDLVEDPGELHDLAPLGGPRLEAFRQIASDVAAAREGREVEQIELDEQTIRELRALGYIR
jgi:arylsulfatase A-like enzyme